MSSYILSNANRFYAAIENTYGQGAAGISGANRFPAVSLMLQQVFERSKRRDKTGTRTNLSAPANPRRNTAFEVRTYLTSWNGAGAPGYGPLFQAALGATPTTSSPLTVENVSGPTGFSFAAAHNLHYGSAISWNNEIRFVSTVPDIATIQINAPFTSAVVTGATFQQAITYRLSTALPSMTLFDYWDPASTAQRAAVGAAVDSFQLTVNGDFHEFTFRGPAADLLDSLTFAPGAAGYADFPTEPALQAFDYTIVPGHLGQAWIGSTSTQLLTLVNAQVQLRNNIETRNMEFGSLTPRAIVPGARQVTTHFEVLAQDDSQSAALYQAAKLRTPLPALLQLGTTQGQLMGIYLPKVVPELPIYNDNQSRLQWDFSNCLSEGIANDELFIAFA